MKLERDAADVKIYGQMASAGTCSRPSRSPGAPHPQYGLRRGPSLQGLASRREGADLPGGGRPAAPAPGQSRGGLCRAGALGVKAADSERVLEKAEDAALRPAPATPYCLCSPSDLTGSPSSACSPTRRLAARRWRDPQGPPPRARLEGPQALPPGPQGRGPRRGWRYLLLDVLASWKDEGADALILGLLEDPDPVLVSAALEVLGKSKRGRASCGGWSRSSVASAAQSARP